MTAKHHINNSSYSQEINSSHADDWWNDMEMEIKTLEVELMSLTLVEHQPWMKVLPVTWALHLKQFPYGLLNMIKSHVCVHGNMQVQDIDFFESWSPVIYGVLSAFSLSSSLYWVFALPKQISLWHFSTVISNLARTCTYTNLLDSILLVTLCFPCVTLLMVCGKALSIFYYLLECLQKQSLK